MVTVQQPVLTAKLKEWMKENKVTQVVLAERVGTTQPTLSRYFSGKQDTLSADLLVALLVETGIEWRDVVA